MFFCQSFYLEVGNLKPLVRCILLAKLSVGLAEDTSSAVVLSPGPSQCPPAAENQSF